MIRAKLTTDEFIKKTRAVHGGQYDYSEISYINWTTHVCMSCPINGVIFATPNETFGWTRMSAICENKLKFGFKIDLLILFA